MVRAHVSTSPHYRCPGSYGRLVTRTLTWAGAVTCWYGQVGHVRTIIFTVDPKI